MLAARFIRTVGKNTAEMLANVTSQGVGFDPKNFELLGLSLGGQAVSFIAKSYKSLTGVKISRVTALDPSGPCFRNLGPDNKLNQTDADFVDMVATNIDGFGNAAPMGHVNFYVNGGEFQPGDILWMPCNTICSHLRAYSIWLAALEYPNSFLAVKCESVKQARKGNCYDNKPMVTNVMGPNVDRTKHGVFYLATNNNFPYFIKEKGLKKNQDYFSIKVKGINIKDVMRM